MFTAHLALFNYVRGVGVNLEAGARKNGSHPTDGAEFGLQRLLDGLAVLLDSVEGKST